ncbi:phage tail terminator protein [Lacticaseibacillus absianus]|uniref:phage tail terminator protein n=1 Tax=Lacticaseibacillus absianus TaxID=2729623 RepID=UPI0015CB47DA|nr:minor capsid protein [Lacticaseibacillus absianus]
MDFAERLRDKINALGQPIQTILGTLTEKESAALTTMPGGQVIRSYMDGEMDKRLQYQYAIKCQAARSAVANVQLWAVTNLLESLETVPSRDGSYHFDSIMITSQPAQSNADEAGFYYWTVDFSADLTTFKKE